jgi:ribosomal-protein-alanine N-acetyltransferase
MEMMPYHPELDVVPSTDVVPGLLPTGGFEPTLPVWMLQSADWRTGLPVQRGPQVTLRELNVEDAPALFAQLTTAEVSRFISPPPASVEGFEKFIRWGHQERAAGRYACFAIVPAGQTTAVGMFQIRLLDADARIAEWGFALGSGYWGTGLFAAAAPRVIDFAFEQMDVWRLDARAAVPNGRGNGALRKVGAVPERVLRQSFERHGERLDQVLWVIHREEWLATSENSAGEAGQRDAVTGRTVH